MTTFLRLLTILWVGALLACAQKPTTTRYREQQLGDTGKTYSYEEWVAAIGKKKTDYLFAHNRAELDFLVTGAGFSIIAEFLNAINTDIGKVSALLGNDYDNGGLGSGLGAPRLVRLINRVDFFANQLRYDTLPVAPANQDTIGNLAVLVNGLADTATVNNKVVALIDAMGVTRYLTDGADEAKIDKLAVLIAHLSPVNTIPKLINEIPAAKITSNLRDLLLNVADGKHLVDVVENVAGAQADNYRRLVYILSNANASAAGVLWRLINQVDSVKPLPVSHISRTKLYSLVNSIENGANWSADNGGQPGFVQAFNLVATSPAGPNSGMVRLVALLNEAQIADAPKLAYLIKNLSDGTGTQKLVRLLQDMKSISDLTNIGNDGILELISDPGLDNSVKNLTDLVEAVPLSEFYRVRDFVNGMAGDGIALPALQPAFRANVASLLIQLPNAEIGRVTSVVTTLTYPAGIRNLIRVAGGVTGDKLTTLLVGINPLTKLNYLLDTTPSGVKIAELVSATNAANVTYIAGLVSGITGADYIDLTTPNQRFNATGLGKLVNLIESTASRADVASMINALSSASHVTRLLAIINPLGNSTNLVCLIDELNTVTWASGTNLGGVIANLGDDVNDPRKLRLIVENITQCNGSNEILGAGVTGIPADFTLLAELMGNAAVSPNTYSNGVGSTVIAQLVTNLTTDAAAVRLAEVLKNTQTTLRYNSVPANISRREGFVRLLNVTPGEGILRLPENVLFPGIGPLHVATMVNRALNANEVYSLINGLDLTGAVIFVGCTDHVSVPDFRPPCITVIPDLALDWPP